MKVTFRLMQDSGVSGPAEDFDGFTEFAVMGNEIDDLARDWAAGQSGHPWDHLIVESEDGESVEIEQAV